MPDNIPTKNIPLSTVPVKSTIGTPIGNTGYGTSKYDYPVNVQDALYNLEEFRHNNQSNWDVLGNASMHFAGSALNAALEIPAIALWCSKSTICTDRCIKSRSKNSIKCSSNWFISNIMIMKYPEK
jgi:hypothetical protein